MLDMEKIGQERAMGSVLWKSGTYPFEFLLLRRPGLLGSGPHAHGLYLRGLVFGR